MDIVQAVQTYVKRMFSPETAGGAAGTAGKMKILLLGNETVYHAYLNRAPNHTEF